MPPRFRLCLFAVAVLLGALPAYAVELTVSAAASLTNAFRDIAQAYEAQAPGSKLLLNFGASGALLQQIAKGAPVDVLATADEETMDQAQRQGWVVAAGRRDFARNGLVAIVPRGSTLSLRQLSDLERSEVRRIAIGNPASVPAGRYARQALAAGGHWSSLEGRLIQAQTVRQALDYVARGEVDAGFVYATDAQRMADKVRVTFAVPLDRPIRYPVAVTRDAGRPAEAARFIAFLLSPAGQTILARHGFLPPQP